MDSLEEDLYKSLVKWLQTFELSKPVQASTPEELSDGVAMAQALVQIAPDHFIRLSSNIHSDIGSNWRLKVNNLKKIIKCLDEYYQDVLNLHLLEAAKPDLTKISELYYDPVEIGKILRLILGCAVNCDAKQEYITRIMDMEESVQQNIMQAIQQLEAMTHGRGRSSLSLLGLESDAKYQRLLSDLEAASDTKDELSQKCHNLETQVVCLTEEKCSLVAENVRLTGRLKELEGCVYSNRTETDGTNAVLSSRTTEMRRQIDSLKEDLFKTETQRDDYRIKVLEQEKDILILQEKVTELQVAAEKAAHLKDEIDALTETADKVKALETTVASYKKKLEEYTDLRKKYKVLKDENSEYYQQNLMYEEELKRNTVYKSQCEVYKKQVAELHQKIDEEIHKVDKLTFDNKKLESKVAVLQREKESLSDERDVLKEANEDLRYQQQQHRQGSESNNGTVASELAPTELRARVKHLEKENLSLKSTAEESVAKQLLLDDTTQRLDKVLEQNRCSNQRILELEAQLEEYLHQQHQQQNLTDDSSIYKQKCTALQEQLATRDSELQATVDRYKKSLEKAKEIIKQLEPNESKLREHVLGKVAGECVTAKEMAPTAPLSTSTPSTMREQEERLMTACFYKLGLACQREAVDDRFALLTASQGQSFLSRQRQAMPRKSIQPYRSK